MIPTTHYLIVAALLFAIGTVGVIVRRNLITMFMCVELMLNAVNLTFIGFARDWGQTQGQIYVLFVMVVAAAEAAVGLAIIVTLSRRTRSLDVDKVDRLKW